MRRSRGLNGYFMPSRTPGAQTGAGQAAEARRPGGRRTGLSSAVSRLSRVPPRSPRQDGSRTPALRDAPIRPPPRPGSQCLAGWPSRPRSGPRGREAGGRARAGTALAEQVGKWRRVEGGARPAQDHRPARRVLPARGPKQPLGPAPTPPRRAAPGGGLTAAARSAFAPRRAPSHRALRFPGGCGRRFHFRRARPISARRRQRRSRWAARPAPARAPADPPPAPSPGLHPGPPRNSQRRLAAPRKVCSAERHPPAGARVPRTPRDHRRAGSSGCPRTAPGTHFRRGAGRSALPSRCPRVHLRLRPAPHPRGPQPVRPLPGAPRAWRARTPASLSAASREPARRSEGLLAGAPWGQRAGHRRPRLSSVGHRALRILRWPGSSQPRASASELACGPRACARASAPRARRVGPGRRRC